MSHVNQRRNGRGLLIPILLIIIGVGLLSYDMVIGLFSKAELEIKIDHTPAILPAAYKVYSNEDALSGKYYLFKMLVTNNGKGTAQNVAVSYDIPGYITNTSLQKIPKLRPGQSAVVTCFPSFNQNIVEKTTPSRERVNIHIEGNGIEATEESFPIEIKGRNELMYTFIPFDEVRTMGEMLDNLTLASCFVTPEDPIVKYYTQQIQEKVLKGEQAVVTPTEEESLRVLTGIYSATLASHMVYSGTSGVPSFNGGVQTTTQSIRLPREVITGNTGLCIELSILYASVMMNMGMNPVIFLVPGHAYPGFKLSNGNLYAIEATGIGGEGLKNIATPQQALQAGMQQIQEFMQGVQSGDDRFSILDVRDAIKNGAIAMELKDDPFLRKKVDDIAASFQTQRTAYAAQAPLQAGMGTPNPGNTSGGNPNVQPSPSGYASYNGSVSFSYPSSWQTIPRSPQTIRQNLFTKSDPSGEAYLEVYEFGGLQNPEMAIRTIQQNVAAKGGQLQYTTAGQSNGFTVFNGATYYAQGSLSWTAAFKPVSGGVAGVAVGVMGGASGNHQNTIMNILNSIR